MQSKRFRGHFSPCKGAWLREAQHIVPSLTQYSVYFETYVFSYLQLALVARYSKKKNTTVITYVCDSHWKRNLRERAQVLHTVVFTLGTLSKDDFERCTSTGSEAFSSFICLDAKKFVFLSFFSLIKTICPGFWTHPLPNVAKSPLPVDVRRSKTLLLKLPFGAKSHVCSKRQTWICTTWPSVPCFLLWNSQLESDVCSFP